MSADIETAAVFDPRIVQKRPAYAVNKGALSVTNAPFNAISASASQMTFNVYVPSENVYVDRAVEWSSDIYLSAVVAPGTTPQAVGAPVLPLGQAAALAPFPLNSLCATLTATINDTVATINSQDVLQPVLRMTDYKENRLQRTCPTMLDTYLQYSDAEGCIQNPLAGYESATAHDIVPNGAFPYVEFTDAAGNALGTATPAFAGANYNAVNGIPVVRSDAASGPWTIYLRVRSTEKLVLSPFVFADSHEHDVGLFGINNIQIVANFQSPARLLRYNPNRAVLSNVQFQTVAFRNAVLNCQFLTPSLSVDLPPKSVVPYMEFPRYISQPSAAIAAGAKDQIVSQTITLPQIPDFLMVYVKPVAVQGSTVNPADAKFADAFLPVATAFDGVRAPLSVQFDNFSGLLSSHTSEELYAMAINNGLEMNWEEWSGRSVSVGASVSGKVSMCGGPLVLRFGKDIVLQEGQAPSLVGNFTLQLSLQVRNTFADAVAAQMYIITANSGFFESIRGSSRIIKGVLSEQQIINAPLAGTHADMSRLVGAGFFSKLGHALSKAKEIYHATKPAISAIKEHLPEGKVKAAMSAVGYGATGAGRRKLADRMM